MTVAYIITKNMVTMGVMKSRLPARQGSEQINHVIQMALVGFWSPGHLNTSRNGITPSFAIAASRRGAPVSDCRHAPTELMTMPMFTSTGGHEIEAKASLSSFKYSFDNSEPNRQTTTK